MMDLCDEILIVIRMDGIASELIVESKRNDTSRLALTYAMKPPPATVLSTCSK